MINSFPISEFYNDFPHAVVPGDMYKGTPRAQFSKLVKADSKLAADNIVIKLTEFYIKFRDIKYTNLIVCYRADRIIPNNTITGESQDDYPLVRSIIYLDHLVKDRQHRHLPYWGGGNGDSYGMDSHAINTDRRGAIGHYNAKGNVLNRRGY